MGNPWILRVGWVWAKQDVSALRRALDTLSDAIKAAEDAVDDAAATGQEDYAEHVLEREIEMIETYIGAAFLLCQNYISGLAAAVLEKGTDLNKHTLLRMGSPAIKGADVTEVQAINAIANCFKHSDEWEQPWDDLDAWINRNSARLAKYTIPVLMELGLDSDHMRPALDAVGVAEYTDLDDLVPMVQRWGEYVAELIPGQAPPSAAERRGSGAE